MYYDQQQYTYRRIKSELLRDDAVLTESWAISLLNNTDNMFTKFVSYSEWVDNCPKNYRIEPQIQSIMTEFAIQCSLWMSSFLNFWNRRLHSQMLVIHRDNFLKIAEINERYELAEMPDELGKRLMMYKLEKG